MTVINIIGQNAVARPRQGESPDWDTIDRNPPLRSLTTPRAKLLSSCEKLRHIADMKTALLSIAALTLQLCGTTSAFNAGGHMVVGLIAYNELTPADRSEVVRILRHHPRFEEHFLAVMPPELKQPADQDRWLFAYAGVWPDAVKSSNQVGEADRQRFNRGVWHYVNFPTFLNDRDKEAMLGGLTVNLDTEPTGDDNFGWNIIQAFKNAQQTYRDPDAADEDKAIAICWMAHLAGDSHQPLHSTALFTMGRFEQGDRGGNSIKTNPGSNLHSVWDGLIIGRGSPSKLSDYNDMRQRATEIERSQSGRALSQHGGIQKDDGV